MEFLETLHLEVKASRSTSLREELWMYKSDSDGFFSTIVVYRPKITMILLIRSCMFLKLMTDYGSHGRDHRHIVCLYVSYTTSACTHAIRFHRCRNVHNTYILCR